MNVNNPVLHFYLSYVFPLVKTIDEGTEEWLHPHRLPHVPGLQRVEVQYFGFMPDFLPRPLMGLVLWLESWLEASPFRQWSAHYMAVYERLPRPEDDQLMSDTNEPRREPAHV
ncbi:MAG: hypothetical protein NTZ05_03650 [Chloroflexi bacterium]|nr:hypothetical protein [Chloroflexota bacterium]